MERKVMKTNQEIISETLLKIRFYKNQKDYYNRQIEKYRSLRHLNNKNTKIMEKQLEKYVEKGVLMGDIPVVDCEQCLQPVWENDLYDGLCSTCSQNDLSGFFE
jgi:hypothetical protein